MNNQQKGAGGAVSVNAADDLGPLLAELREMNTRLGRIEAAMSGVSHRIESLEELREDLWPMVEGLSHSVREKLQDLEDAGALGFARESVRVAERVATSFDEADVRLLGDNVVGILETVRNLTQPEVLDVADRAAVALRASDATPSRKVGLWRALRDPEVRRGMTLMLTVLREVGAEPANGDGVSVVEAATA